MTVKRAWFVVTPAGEAGPFWSPSDAHTAAAPFGWEVTTRIVTIPYGSGEM
jgi:hypothetical protein